jgi:hypothetical protein
MLSLGPKQCFNGLHDQSLTIAKTIVSQLFRIRDESLGVELRMWPFLWIWAMAYRPERG